MTPIALAITALAALAAAAATAAAPPSDPQAVARGKAAFTQYGCYQCHGYVGQGANGVAATLAPNTRPLAYYLAYVRRPTGQMPPYSQLILADAVLTDIHAYLAAIPVGKPASEIPLLSGR